jgi:hypothetical protein
MTKRNLIPAVVVASMVLAGCGTAVTPVPEALVAGQQPLASSASAPTADAERAEWSLLTSQACPIETRYQAGLEAAAAWVQNIGCGSGKSIKLQSGVGDGYSLAFFHFDEVIELDEIDRVRYLSQTTSRPAGGSTRLSFALDLTGDGVADEYLSYEAGTGSEALALNACGEVSTDVASTPRWYFNSDGVNSLGSFDDVQAAYPNAHVIDVFVIVDYPPAAPPNNTVVYIDDFTIDFTDPARGPIILAEPSDVMPSSM